MIIYRTSLKGLYAAKTGWKPNKCIAQSNALGTVDPLFCALKEQKEEERKSTSLAPFALTARQLVNYRLPMVLPWAIFRLGLRPVFARNRLLMYNVLKCYLAVFAPSLFVTSTVVHCHGMLPKRAKGTIFSKSASFASASHKGKTHTRKCKAAKTNNTKIHWTLNKLTAKTTNKYKKTANHFAVSI